MKFHFIYKTIRDDGKFYIGMHSTNDLDDGYMGSGVRLVNSIKKHGIDKHRREIIIFANTREELATLEREMVTEELLMDTMCMNLKIGGDGGWSHVDWNGRRHSPKSKQQISESQKNRWTTELRSAWAEKQTGAGNAHYGKKHSEETRSKMSNAQRGVPKHHTPEARAAAGERLANANRGKPKSEETKLKMAEARRKYWAAKKLTTESRTAWLRQTRPSELHLG